MPWATSRDGSRDRRECRSFSVLAAHTNLDVEVAKFEIKNSSCGDVHKFIVCEEQALLAAQKIVGGPGIPFADRLCAELSQSRASGSNGLSFLLVQARRVI
jgi:hypothetical protein